MKKKTFLFLCIYPPCESIVFFPIQVFKFRGVWFLKNNDGVVKVVIRIKRFLNILSPLSSTSPAEKQDAEGFENCSLSFKNCSPAPQNYLSIHNDN